MVFMGIYTVIRTHGIVIDILKYKKISNFYKNILKNKFENYIFNKME